MSLHYLKKPPYAPAFPWDSPEQVICSRYQRCRVVRTPATGSSAGGGTAGWTVKEIPLQRDPAPDGNPRPILQHQNTSRLVQLPRFPGRRHIGAALFSRTWRTLLFPNLRQSFL